MAALPVPPIEPRAARARRIRRILLATDLSPASEEAHRQGLELAEDLGAELVILSVIEPAAGRRAGERPRRVDEIRSIRERAAQALVRRGHAAGLTVAFLIWEGQPGEAIVDAAVSEGVDLIVVGSHGRGSMGRLILGSVSEHVVRNAGRPVLVAPTARQ